MAMTQAVMSWSVIVQLQVNNIMLVIEKPRALILILRYFGNLYKSQKQTSDTQALVDNG